MVSVANPSPNMKGLALGRFQRGQPPPPGAGNPYTKQISGIRSAIYEAATREDVLFIFLRFVKFLREMELDPKYLGVYAASLEFLVARTVGRTPSDELVDQVLRIEQKLYEHLCQTGEAEEKAGNVSGAD